MTDQQQAVTSMVKEYANIKTKQIINVSPMIVSDLIDSLNRGCSPGIDGITSEHLTYGKSYELCQHFSRVYSLILSYGIVPEIFRTGIVIPLLKKPTINPNDPTNYRPITLSSVHTKLIEMVIMPNPEISKNQLGFRPDRGASFGISFLHDIVGEVRVTPMLITVLVTVVDPIMVFLVRNVLSWIVQ